MHESLSTPGPGANPIRFQEQAAIATLSSQDSPSTPTIDPVSQQVLDLVESVLEDNKAEDVITIPLAGKSDIADFMVIASGRSTTHVKAMAGHLSVKLKQASLPPLSTAGEMQGDWVAIDAVDVLVHIFRPEVREFYKLEKMWMPDFAKDDAVGVEVLSAD